MIISEQIGQSILNLSQSWTRQTGQVLQERLGVGLAQFKIMNLLQNKSGVAQRQLADNLNQTEAAVSRQIKLMEDRGWLQTTVDPSERRKHRAQLTPAGLRITIAAQEILAEQYKTFCKNLTEKQHLALLKLLQTL